MLRLVLLLLLAGCAAQDASRELDAALRPDGGNAADAGNACTMALTNARHVPADWATAQDAAAWCPLIGGNRNAIASSPCAGLRAVAAGGVDSTQYFLYDETTGALVAIADLQANTARTVCYEGNIPSVPSVCETFPFPSPQPCCTWGGTDFSCLADAGADGD